MPEIDYRAAIERLMQLGSKMGETWPAKMAQTMMEAAKLPGDVYAGRTTPNDPEYYNRAADLAGLAMTGGVAGVPKKAGEATLGAGPIRAYHGSPYDFDKFDMSRIGSGEGAQAYGHGLYFAENPTVARGYREGLTGGSTHVHFDDPSQIFHPDELSGASALAARAALKYDDLSGWKQFIGRNASSDDQATEALRMLEEGTLKKAEPGRIYEVDIHADPARFLDWDKPLGQHAPEVRDIVHRFGRNPDTAFNRVADDMRGSDIYRAATPGFVSSGPYKEPGHALASQSLRKAGIPGIKYLDQGSRDAGSGSSNYVVFDDALVEILRKYGLAGLTAGPAVGAAVSQQSDGGM